MATRLFFALAATLVIAFGARAASAACSNPVKPEAFMFYNQDYHVLQFCNGTNWVAVGSLGGACSTSCGVTSGLVGHWKLDETTGTTAADSSGNNYAGTLNGNPVWASGKIANSLTFDGNGDNVNIGLAASLALTSTGSLAAWIKTNENSGFPVIVANADFVADTNGYLLTIESNGQVRLEIANGSTYLDTYSTGSYNDDQWHFAVGTWDGSYMRVYIDGVLANAPRAQTLNVVSGVNPIKIGTDPGPSAGGSDFPGKIDDVRIYNRALTSGEVLQMYNGGAGCSN